MHPIYPPELDGLLYVDTSINPTLIAFRYSFRARLCSTEEHGAGWISFCHRRVYNIMGELPDNQMGYRTKFVFFVQFPIVEF